MTGSGPRRAEDTVPAAWTSVPLAARTLLVAGAAALGSLPALQSPAVPDG